MCRDRKEAHNSYRGKELSRRKSVGRECGYFSLSMAFAKDSKNVDRMSKGGRKNAVLCGRGKMWSQAVVGPL
jgi:hypothetical protein